VITTLPIVSSSEHGDGTSITTGVYFNDYGNPIWSYDGEGFVDFASYDAGTGALIQTIDDVTYSSLTAQQQTSFASTGWLQPVSGLHLSTTMTVDGLGRTTSVVDSSGDVSYTVYDDINHEIRSYVSWNDTLQRPVGPIHVIREDRANGYLDQITMSAVPSISGGVPDGQEVITNVESLIRSHVNVGGQTVAIDEYFDLNGLVYDTAPILGVLDTNYYRTTFAYDERGETTKTVNAVGTITITLRDGLDRPTAVYVGTDDTTTNGLSWTPMNADPASNMVLVTSYIYDDNTSGDGNLTRVIQHVDDLSANDRVTAHIYDWRNRLITTKAGVEAVESIEGNRPLTVHTLDNLGRLLVNSVYDGDTVSLVDSDADGVPDTLPSALIRAQSTNHYDGIGRVYLTETSIIDQSDGTIVSPDSENQAWYDNRGLLIKSKAPNGLVTKNVYDGDRRLVATYLTNGAGDAALADANSVSDDVVFSEFHYTYDDNGNLIATMNKERHGDESDVLTGALGDGIIGPLARVTYSVSYFDELNRKVAEVYVGTNGGNVYIRPETIPARSDTVLVTSYVYDDTGRIQSIVDPLGIESRYEYDALGRLVREISAYDDGIVSDDSDATIEYTYNGLGNITKKTVLQSGHLPDQIMEYRYGVVGSYANNDLLASIHYADPNTGVPDGSISETYEYNRLGELIRTSQANGSTISSSFDNLGRLQSQIVDTSDGSGDPENLYEYDVIGNLSLITDARGAETSYSYDSLGRLLRTVYADPDASGPLVSTATSQTYGAIGNALTSTDEIGQVTTYSYDLLGRLIRSESPDPDGQGLLLPDVTTYRYNIQGDRDIVTGPGENAGGSLGSDTIVSVVDEFGRLEEVINPSPDGILGGTVTQYSYDRGGRVINETDPLGNISTYTYDDLGRLIKEEFPYPADGSGRPTSTYHYDVVGNLIESVDAQGNRTWHFYDAWNQKIAETDAIGVDSLLVYIDEVVAQGAAAFDYFGYSVDIQGDHAIFGAYGRDDEGDMTGAAYIFQRKKTGWVQTAMLTSDTPGIGDWYGRSVAIGKDVAFVASPHEDDFGSDYGAVYIYEYDGISWNQSQKITAQDGICSALFSNSLINMDYDDGTLIVGAPGDDTNGMASGAAHIFCKSSGSWIEIAKLVAPDGDSFDMYGISVAVDDDLVVVGARNDEAYAGSAGSAYIYQKVSGSWIYQSKIVSADITSGDWFGQSADIDNGIVVVGSNDAAYVFENLDVTGHDWQQTAKLTSADGQLTNSFGYSVAIENNDIAVGDRDGGSEVSGHIHLFEYDGANWIGLTKLSSDSGMPLDYLGHSIAISGDTVVGGIPQDDDSGTDSGSGIFFENAFNGTGLGIINSRHDVTDPSSLDRTSFTSYDNSGNVISVTDALGNTTTFEYDQLNRQVTQTLADPDGTGALTAPVTQYDYDLTGNLLSVTDPEDNVTSYVYDLLGRMTSETNDLGDSRSYIYDERGLTTLIIDRNSRVRNFTYDNLGRMTTEVWRETVGGLAIKTIDYTYDQRGRVSSVSDNVSSYSYTYDNQDRVIQVSNIGTPVVPTTIQDLDYDAEGRLTKVSVTIDNIADHITEYFYDDMDRLVRVERTGASVETQRIDLSYTSVGLYSEIHRYSDLAGTTLAASSIYTYDKLNRLVELRYTNAAASEIALYTWTYDDAGRLVASTSPDDDATFTYDNNGQLLAADHHALSGIADEAYTYDAAGNRTTANASVYTTGDDNRLTSDGTHTYTYDDEGNRLSKTTIVTGESVEYVYDHRNRLTHVIFKDSLGVASKQVRYTYDVNDLRIATEIDASADGTYEQVERFVLDGSGRGNILLVFDQTSSLTHRYLHGPTTDQILAEEVISAGSSTLHWFLEDHMGSIRDVIDNAGTTIDHIVYDTFGNIASQTSTTYKLRFGFTGRELASESGQGVWYYRRRFYDAQVGRFLTQDPTGFNAGDVNLYRYVTNSPLLYTDPTGRVAESAVGVDGLIREDLEGLYIDVSGLTNHQLEEMSGEIAAWLIGQHVQNLKARQSHLEATYHAARVEAAQIIADFYTLESNRTQYAQDHWYRLALQDSFTGVFYDAPVGLAQEAFHTVTHPKETLTKVVEGVMYGGYNTVTNPIGTYHAIIDSVKEVFETPRGAGQAAGSILWSLPTGKLSKDVAEKLSLIRPTGEAVTASRTSKAVEIGSGGTKSNGLTSDLTGEKAPVIGEVRPYNVAKANPYSGYDNHHLDPPLGRKDPHYNDGPTIAVRNDNSGGKVPGGQNYHTGQGGFQTSLNKHITHELGMSRSQWISLSDVERKIHLRRYYASLGIPFPE